LGPAENLSVYWDDETVVVPDGYTTQAYSWQEFLSCGVVRGTVTAGGLAVPDALVSLNGYDVDRTDSNGAFRLTAPDTESYVIAITADPALAPWQILVDGQLQATGTSASVAVEGDAVVEVNFVSAPPPPP
jgi:hypothetical protein